MVLSVSFLMPPPCNSVPCSGGMGVLRLFLCFGPLGKPHLVEPQALLLPDISAKQPKDRLERPLF